VHLSIDVHSVAHPSFYDDCLCGIIFFYLCKCNKCESAGKFGLLVVKGISKALEDERLRELTYMFINIHVM
jgi:hypothetical protein